MTGITPDIRRRGNLGSQVKIMVGSALKSTKNIEGAMSIGKLMWSRKTGVIYYRLMQSLLAFVYTASGAMNPTVHSGFLEEALVMAVSMLVSERKDRKVDIGLWMLGM